MVWLVEVVMEEGEVLVSVLVGVEVVDLRLPQGPRLEAVPPALVVVLAAAPVVAEAAVCHRSSPQTHPPPCQYRLCR